MGFVWPAKNVEMRGSGGLFHGDREKREEKVKNMFNEKWWREIKKKGEKFGKILANIHVYW